MIDDERTAHRVKRRKRRRTDRHKLATMTVWVRNTFVYLPKGHPVRPPSGSLREVSVGEIEALMRRDLPEYASRPGKGSAWIGKAVATAFPQISPKHVRIGRRPPKCRTVYPGLAPAGTRGPDGSAPVVLPEWELPLSDSTESEPNGGNTRFGLTCEETLAWEGAPRAWREPDPWAPWMVW